MPSRLPSRLAAVLALALLLAVTLTACEDPLSASRAPVPEEPSRATLVSLEDGGLREASAFDVIGPDVVRTDQSPEWDFALSRSGEGDLRFAPRNVVLGTSSAAGLQPFEGRFEELTVAPDGGYVTDESVPLDPGAVYSVRSRRDPRVGVSCFRFMKMEVLSVDRDAGRVTLRYLANPNCGRRTLRPGASGEDQDV